MKLDWKTCFRAGITLFLLYCGVQLLPWVREHLVLVVGACSPIILGGIIAYFVNILMSFYERTFFYKTTNKVLVRFQRPVCMTAAFCTLLLAIYLLIKMIVPQLIDCAGLLFQEVPNAINELIVMIEENQDLAEYLPEIPELQNLNTQISKIIQTLIYGIEDVVVFVTDTLTSVFSMAVNLLLGLIVSIYLLSGKERLKNQGLRILNAYVPEKWMEKVLHVLAVFHDCFHRYIVGQCIEALILGALCTIGMKILGFPYEAMIGTLIGFTALVPVAGAYIGGAIGAFMILTVSPVESVLFIVFLVILQQIEGNVIYPKVVGSSIGLPGLWVLVAITIGGNLMGILGMFLSVPIMAAAYRLLKEQVEYQEAKKEKQKKKEREYE